jgi:enoyl-CoA hydratase/carnithine racemase
VQVETHEDGQIYVITLNRPERLNAIGGGLNEGLYGAMTRFRDDPRGRVAILTGAGERAFCAGADLKESAERVAARERGEDVSPFISHGQLNHRLAERSNVWKPTIAAINGIAVAGGLLLALECDIRIAADHAQLGMTEARFNRAGSGWMAMLARHVGVGNALHLALWADQMWSAQRAYEVGLVQEVVPREQLMERAMEYAQRMLDMAPRSVRHIKQAVYRGFTMTAEEQEAFGSALDQGLHGMQDTIEGARAFAEKRRPRYTDS